MGLHCQWVGEGQLERTKGAKGENDAFRGSNREVSIRRDLYKFDPLHGQVAFV